MNTWSPVWARHVQGEIGDVREDSQGVTYQALVLTCASCSDRTEYRCTSGAPRQRIAQYASQHVHRDPLR